MFRTPVLAAALCISLWSHAPPTPIPVPPLQVKGNTLADSNGRNFLLRGVGLPDWASATPFVFRVIQQRWNMNQVRFPADVSTWAREGQPYMDRIAKAVAAANQEGLIVVLAAVGNEAAGLPGAGTADFWRAASTTFRATPAMIFALYHEPVRRNGAGWREWRDAMQSMISAIRGMGAQHAVAAPAFHDEDGFQGLTSGDYLQDANVVYEVHPYFNLVNSDAQRDAAFGTLAGRFPVLAGAWGIPFGQSIPACTSVPRDLTRINELIYQQALYFELRGISWSAADFATGSLLRAGSELLPTTLDTAIDTPGTCDSSSNPQTGIGQFVLTWMTGDPGGFGSLQASQIASAAGGFSGPVCAGEILSIYGQGIGPAQGAQAAFDANGRLPVDLADTTVLFDGVPAPIFFTSGFQVNVQVPWEVAGRPATVVQLIYRGVPSNQVTLPTAAIVPDLLIVPGSLQAAALNQNGAVNDIASPADRGGVISFFVTGAGQTSPTAATGLRYSTAGTLLAPVILLIGGVRAEVLYAGPAPGLAGVVQINARIPASIPLETPVDRISVYLTVDGVGTRQGITFWSR